METAVEKSTEKNPEKFADQNPVSVCSVSFAPPIISDTEREFLIEHSKFKKIEKIAPKSSFSKKIFKWRNAAAVAAILTVGVIHFAYQISVIKTEKSQIAEVPPKVEQIREQPPLPVENTKPLEFKAKKADAVLSPKAVPVIKPSQPDIAPPKLQLKKKDALESKAERLRRTEKILTGI